eukprot:gene22682-biopygen8163
MCHELHENIEVAFSEEGLDGRDQIRMVADFNKSSEFSMEHFSVHFLVAGQHQSFQGVCLPMRSALPNCNNSIWIVFQYKTCADLSEY